MIQFNFIFIWFLVCILIWLSAFFIPYSLILIKEHRAKKRHASRIAEDKKVLLELVKHRVYNPILRQFCFDFFQAMLNLAESDDLRLSEKIFNHLMNRINFFGKYIKYHEDKKE